MGLHSPDVLDSTEQHNEIIQDNDRRELYTLMENTKAHAMLSRIHTTFPGIGSYEKIDQDPTLSSILKNLQVLANLILEEYDTMFIGIEEAFSRFKHAINTPYSQGGVFKKNTIGRILGNPIYNSEINSTLEVVNDLLTHILHTKEQVKTSLVTLNTLLQKIDAMDPLSKDSLNIMNTLFEETMHEYQSMSRHITSTSRMVQRIQNTELTNIQELVVLDKEIARLDEHTNTMIKAIKDLVNNSLSKLVGSPQSVDDYVNNE